MAELFSEGQIRELHEAFSTADKFRKGVIDCCTLGQVMRRLGHLVTDEEVEDMMESICEQHNKISFADFLTLMAVNMKHANSKEVVKEAFEVLDVDGDGLIGVAELERSMTALGDKLSPGEYQEMIKAMGLGVGDYVTLDYFRNFIGEL